ncbi:MAG TPA: patatin-like phospholipase family protein [Pyrinomonadaceae bacterium]|jgi:hypothetical protein
MTATNWIDWLINNGFEELFEIEKSKPHTFDGITWSPNEVDKLAAWEFYTELRTRITTQRLAYRAGDEGTALDSIYRLFELSRGIIKTNSGCKHFAALTTRVLNTHVRPFTAKWHQVKLSGLLSSADVRFQFRRELSDLQLVLRKFTHLMGLLADDLPQLAEAEAQPATSKADGLPRLWDSLPFGVAAGTKSDNPVCAQIDEKEAEAIKLRRAYYSLAGVGQGVDAVGLSISGGGIRSATFALGVIEQLARKGILYQVDYLSTVSGGGYLGAFISSFLNDDENDKVSLKPATGELPFGAQNDPESQGVRQLRNHSKYLTEGGLSTFVTIIALVIYGLVISITLLAPLLLASVLVAAVFFQNSFKAPVAYLPLSLPTQLILLALAILVLLLPLAQRLGRGRKLQRWWERICVGLAALSALLLVGEALRQLLEATSHIGGPAVLFFSTAAAPVILGALGLWLGVASRAGRVLLGMFALVGPLLLVAAFLWLAEYFIVAPPFPDIQLGAGLNVSSTEFLSGLFVCSLLYSTFIVNINYASPHAFYRNRLARTYLTRPSNGDTAVRACDPQKLSGMNEFNKAPYHLINCAVNIPNCKDPNLRGRNTDFFVLSKYFCGGPITGFHPTAEWEQVDSHLDLGTATAISGAAAAPHMGTLTSARYTFLLALLNVRLGYWLRKPAPRSRWIKNLLSPVGWYYFFLELSGLMSEKTAFLNLSDGGHIENLGIYELLRRRCKFVIAIDGEADPDRSFGGLLKLTQLAKIDLGVTIEPDLTDLRTDKEGLGRSHFGLSRIEYRDGEYGLLLYIKSSLTGNESEFLKKYRAENPAFPHQSTAQQLFSETQFEAYRVLGEHIAQDLFRKDLVDDWKPGLSVREWFKRLSTHLLD